MASVYTGPDLSSIETLNGPNYDKWKLDIEVVLGLMDLDLALIEDKPAALTASSTSEQKLKFKNWETSNRMSLLVMEKTISASVLEEIPASENAKEFLATIVRKYKPEDKAQVGKLITALTSAKFDGVGSVREYIMGLAGIANKLKALKVPIDETFLVHIAVNSLPSSYGQLVRVYSIMKEMWTVNELIYVCVLEEQRQKNEKGKRA
ncbi:PREDICTED: uncharacterized protein LOC107881677 [Prunus mume]|uniref:Uncharacterized protein LOC107881677 n=1 Tax=Prunus mume TaxID=102107 RepID=A0ABM1LVS1_PRUMU|nr:PREDICTED: uncharacterized protein LOC107881677 [Prunus mume]